MRLLVSMGIDEFIQLLDAEIIEDDGYTYILRVQGQSIAIDTEDGHVYIDLANGDVLGSDFKVPQEALQKLRWKASHIVGAY